MAREYPTVALSKIIHRIQKLPPLILNDNSLTIMKFANACGYSYPFNGTSQQFLTSCRDFGVVSINPRENTAKLTPTALKIVTSFPPLYEDLLALAISPPLFHSMYKHFSDDKVPYRPELTEFLEKTIYLTDRQAMVAATCYYSTMAYIENYRPLALAETRKKLFDPTTMISIHWARHHDLETILETVVKLVRTEQERIAGDLEYIRSVPPPKD